MGPLCVHATQTSGEYRVVADITLVLGENLDPLRGCGPDGWVYTVHSAKWQSRSNMSAEWADIEGTEVTTRVLCPYTTTTPGDYRLVYDTTIAVSPDEEFRGNYASQNYFTVASGG